MAFDKNSNSFTIIFSIVMVVIVGAALALVSLGLKEQQNLNDDIKKKMNILGAINVDCTRNDAVALYDEFVKEAYVVSNDGIRSEGDALGVDVQKDFRDVTLKPEDKKFPLYVCERDGKTFYIVPMVGKGLWGPIWGFVALQDDFSTIYGAKFDHKSETPGLGSEIREKEFQKRFYESQGVKKINYESDKIFEILKGGSVPSKDNQVDGLTGGTITSKGVEEMIIRTFGLYSAHFKTLKK